MYRVYSVYTNKGEWRVGIITNHISNYGHEMYIQALGLSRISF